MKYFALTASVCLLGTVFGVTSLSAAPTAAQSSVPHNAFKSGIEGHAFRHHLMGTPPPKPLPPLPMAGVEMVVTDVATGKVVARVKTDKNGHFKVHLKSGKYTIEAKSGNWSFLHAVNVPPDKWISMKAHFRYNGPLPPSALRLR